MPAAPPITHPDIRQFAEARINLSAEVAKERRQKVNDLRERLAKWMKEHPEYGLAKSYLAGSLAKGTALRTSSDVDVALYIKYDGERRADRNLSDWIAERLRKAYPQMSREQIEPKDHSVTIKYKEAGVDIDIVPVFYDDDPHDKGWLVSKRTGRLVQTSVPMHLAFTRKRKEAQPQHFAQVVRLVKWWATEQKAANANFRFKSFMAELICAHLVDGGQSMADYPNATAAFFNYIVKTGLKKRIAFTDYYRASELPHTSSDPIQVYDPVNPSNNVACQYTDQNRRLIVAAAQNALDAVNEAHTAANKEHAVQMWKNVLSSSYNG